MSRVHAFPTMDLVDKNLSRNVNGIFNYKPGDLEKIFREGVKKRR